MANERRLIDAEEIMDLFIEQLLRGPFDMGFALDEALKAAKTVNAVGQERTLRRTRDRIAHGVTFRENMQK